MRFKCFFRGHDWKCVGQEKQEEYWNGAYWGTKILIAFQCQRCKELKFTKSNGFYKDLEVK